MSGAAADVEIDGAVGADPPVDHGRRYPRRALVADVPLIDGDGIGIRTTDAGIRYQLQLLHPVVLVFGSCNGGGAEDEAEA